ncbi:MAG: oligosaccharide flippase family protein [Planctomycetes bacterium]|nr:oligosaccharide flippase family protein [Planctomycetota bacterium]
MTQPAAARAEAAPGALDLAGLRRRALGNTAWTVFSLGTSNVLRLAGNVVLAGLLFPEAFGLMAICGVVVQGLWLFSDVGTGPAIVQSERGDDPAFLDTAWTLQLLRGAVLCLISAALAWPVAAFYGASDPLARDLVFYLPAVGLTAVLDGGASSRMHSYSRHLRVRELTLLELLYQVSGLAVMVAVAWVYPSVWALVVGALVKSALRTALSHLVLEGPPNRLRIERAAARAQLRFGKWVFVSTMLTFLASQSDRLLLGRLVPFDLLGVYGMALALATLPVFVLAQVSAKVIFPVLSRLERGPQQTAEAARVRGLLVVCGAALVGALYPAGPALIDLLYDERYAAAGWILQVLLVGGWFQLLEAPNASFLLARGETRGVAVGNAVKLVGLLTLLPLGYAAHGFAGAVVGVAVADAAKYLASAALVRRRGLRLLRGDAVLTATVAATCGLGVAAAGAARGEGAGALATLLVAAAAGGLPWAGFALLAWRLGPRLRASTRAPAT